jgi:hypothetical protein
MIEPFSIQSGALTLTMAAPSAGATRGVQNVHDLPR